MLEAVGPGAAVQDLGTDSRCTACLTAKGPRRSINLTGMVLVWEETGAPGGNQREHGENILTPHRKVNMIHV